MTGNQRGPAPPTFHLRIYWHGQAYASISPLKNLKETLVVGGEGLEPPTFSV